MHRLKLLLCLAIAGLSAGTASAHDPGLSRGELRRVDANVQLRLAFHGSDISLALQRSADGSLGDPAVRSAWQRRLETGIVARCIEPQSAAIPLRVGIPEIDQGNGLVATLLAPATGCHEMEFSEPLLSSLLNGHRQILLVYDAAGAHADTRVLTAGAATFHGGPELATAGSGSTTAGWHAMLGEGMHHILIGYDHLAFLLVLLLAVLIHAQERSEPSATAARRLLGVITAFTVAHSLTLGLAATGLVHVPGRPVEALIALTIVIAGLLNLSRTRRIEGAWLAFGFGLIHGLGFAGAFAELAPGDGPVGWLTVAQFNLGVELGQFTVALPAFCLGLYVMSRVPTGTRLARQGSALAAGLGALWLVQRTVLA